MPKIFIAGHNGMVGSALAKALSGNELLLRDRRDLDLTDPSAVNSFFKTNKIDEVYLAAAKVGGIMANSTEPTSFLMDNLKIEMNVIEAAHRHGASKLLFLGSSCIYPRLARQPIVESELMAGALEPSNEAYAIAKITGIKICEAYNNQHKTDFRSVMPCNLYGPNDNFDLNSSHVLPAMIRKIHNARVNDLPGLILWGTGAPLREFLHVDDLADACVRVMSLDKSDYDSLTSSHCSHINIGSGHELKIKDLAKLICQIIKYRGVVHFDSSKPDGTPRKILDNSIMAKIGWKPSINLHEGISSTYKWFLANH